MFNVEAGATAADDDLPARFSDVPIIVEGKERRVSRDDKERMRQDYYGIRRWDKRGRPSRELIDALNIRRRKP